MDGFDTVKARVDKALADADKAIANADKLIAAMDEVITRIGNPDMVKINAKHDKIWNELNKNEP